MPHTRIFASLSSNWSLFNWSPCNVGAGLLGSIGTGSCSSECSVLPLTLKAAQPVGAAMSIFTFIFARYLEEKQQCIITVHSEFSWTKQTYLSMQPSQNDLPTPARPGKKHTHTVDVTVMLKRILKELQPHTTYLGSAWGSAQGCPLSWPSWPTSWLSCRQFSASYLTLKG